MNDSPPAGSWIARVPPHRLAAFAAFGAVYVGIFLALALERMAAYLGEAARTFEFARPWLERFVR